MTARLNSNGTLVLNTINCILLNVTKMCNLHKRCAPRNRSISSIILWSETDMWRKSKFLTYNDIPIEAVLVWLQTQCRSSKMKARKSNEMVTTKKSSWPGAISLVAPPRDRAEFSTRNSYFHHLCLRSRFPEADSEH